MSPVRLAVTLLAAALLAAPTALAAAARGELSAGEVALPAGATLASAGLDLRHEGTTLPALLLDATDVSVQRMGSSRAQLSSLYSHEVSQVNERASYSAARLTLGAGAGDALVALRSTGPASAQLAASSMRGVEGALLAAPETVSDCETASVVDYCLEVRGVHELAGGAEAALSGAVTLLLFGPTLVVESGGERIEFASGLREGGDGVRSEETWVIVHAKRATGTFASESARLYAASPTLEAAEARLVSADGLLRVGGRDYRASDDDVLAAGALLLVPGPVAPGTDNGYREPVYVAAFTTRITGDVVAVNLNAANAFLDSPAERAGLFAVLAVLAGGIAYAWHHLAFLAAALYTRLAKPDILDNEVRNRIFDIIRENPGISAREVHRRSEQSWGTVVYHLRQLERHHIVVSRSLGRTRNYYENHGKYRGMEIQLACLQSERARVLARAIANTPGITQEQLAAASGYPQPTTSYYVRKLKQAGLVEEQREGRYAKYVPHADLPRFIAMSEHAPGAQPPGPTGVQA